MSTIISTPVAAGDTGRIPDHNKVVTDLGSLNTDKAENSDLGLLAGVVSGLGTSKANKAIVRTYTGNATWSKPTGITAVFVEMWGGGGSGGASVSGSNPGGGGGGGGAYNSMWIQASDLGGTEAVVVGAGGSAVSNNQGNPGGNSSFGTHVYAY